MTENIDIAVTGFNIAHSDLYVNMTDEKQN